MCGIAGFVARSGTGNSECAPEVLRSIEHRGPDDVGWLCLTGNVVTRGRRWAAPSREPEVLFLHRRLSIIDTSDSGWQPMSTSDGRFHVIFNGEIYNYKELREELITLGHRFCSRSDTEVLLAAYAQWGHDALSRFVGMFAFALLDVGRSIVLLARDFFGIKPLYYATADGIVRFGSEIKALFALGHSNKDVNPERLLYYLRYGMTDFGEETLFAAIRQLPPAHYMEICTRTGVADGPVCFWHADTGPDLDISFDEAAQTLQDLFLRSVELHLRSDVPIGTALSGGIDSSSIVAASRRLDPNAEIHAFSFISEEAETNEERWIDVVGRANDVHVHKVRSSSHQLRDSIETLAHFHDEPFGSTSIYAQFEVFRAAHKAGVKVMLDGQGADEILAGYRVYQGARLASLVRNGEWSQAYHLMRGMSHLESFRWTEGVIYCADHLLLSPLQRPGRWLVGKESFPRWLNRQWFSQRGADILVNNHTSASNVLKCSLARSLREGLPSLLRYEDRNSMANSVESRVPFLTPDLVNFLGRLPERYLIACDGTSKAVFRKAMRGIVPDAILDRRDKLGFATPERLWLTELDPWVRTTLNSEQARRMPFLDYKAALSDWLAMRDRKKPFNFRVWRWLSIIDWSDRFEVCF